MSSLPPALDSNFKRVLARGVSFRGFCYRNVGFTYANREDALSAVGSRVTGGRYNFLGTFLALYLSLDDKACYAEMAGGRASVDPAVLPRVILSVEVSLSRVLDLTDPSVLEALGVDPSVLTDTDWKSHQKALQEAPTQVIGRLAKEAGFEALLVPSARLPGGKNLCVFMDNVPPAALSLVNADKLPAKRLT